MHLVLRISIAILFGISEQLVESTSAPNVVVLSVTVCGVGGRTLSVGFHPFRFGWMNLKCGEGGS
jgi:hypothetical protein